MLRHFLDLLGRGGDAIGLLFSYENFLSCHLPENRLDFFFKDLKRRGRRDDGLLFIKRQLPSHCDGMGEG